MWDLARDAHVPVCEQRVAARAALTRLAFSAAHPVLLIGDERCARGLWQHLYDHIITAFLTSKLQQGCQVDKHSLCCRNLCRNKRLAHYAQVRAMHSAALMAACEPAACVHACKIMQPCSQCLQKTNI